MALPRLITRDHQQAGVCAASELCSQPDAGLFGPGSITWQLMRENLLTLAQGRIALLMLADSRVAQLLPAGHDVIQRLHHTQVFLLKVIFGNLDQAMLTLDSPAERRRTLFDIGDERQLLFVVSSWMDSCRRLYEAVIEPLNSAHQERLFEETMLLARVLGITEAHLPAHWHAWRGDMEQRLRQPWSLSPQRRRLGHVLIREQGYPGRLPYGQYLTLAPFQLPEALCQQFRLPERNLASHRRYQQRLQRLMEITRRLPDRLRYQPAWHEAMQRLDGRARADLTTRLLNRWWTGQANLVNSGWSMPREARPVSL
ncbi:hypothetical protein A11A3_15502 [Alcanivorax hongdengensis A-11-3]|uniref:ER-bound oxygenase mpaB/mpaB'/Rubber oxygenase catalytic domain-containing protein n=1 Tax=Alcanivorax hongdengensis A-11-3 TaxID=1177179 RepID=L0W7Y8_9GAMM|nr:oxygenase MpaB family protein [Alcanivorax hongdengensis]EKF73079.1 hypothetical protein A11A3_15502 [Alcanivorax hongdengensis A-11-3]